ncbi:hypothetical protein ACH5RR_017608 [Cinchona calisaya]|uniref:Uncharacterized protein n=1 Tax=Cinchona calisaya TaxID=153742 RepID=A0ABD2ZJU6_9GENT
MEFSDEWKSLWPISSVFNPPLLLSENPPASKRPRLEEQEYEGKTHEQIGPIIFTPCPKTIFQLYSSPSLTARLPPPYPKLSLPRFLQTTTNPYLLPSVASDIASEFGPELVQAHHKSYDYLHGFNALQLLPLNSSSYLAFFPTGENCDQVGFVKICVQENSQLAVEANRWNQEAFVAKEKFNSRILQLLVNPVSDCDDSLLGDTASSSSSVCLAIVGYLMACTMHSVHWYLVRSTSRSHGSWGKSPMVHFVAQRLFRSCEVVHACWSPHLCEEGVLLLETGEMYLFDISSCLKKHSSSMNRIGIKKLNALWSENTDLEESGNGGWLSVEFSWHPRILVVAHISAVFLVDARSEGCSLSCLLKIQMLSAVQNDRFTALCRAGCDGFSFCVACRRLLLLCDVRQPFRPLLRWVHGLDNPCYITVFSLSELRSNTKGDKFKWATESGSCILLGSFWNCEFSLFVYGPNNKTKSVSSEISKFCKSFYAWGLPSEFSLSTCDTHCGSCLVRKEFLKDALPDWMDWRQKTDVVLGFGILGREPLGQLSKSDSCGGFLLIRLMSSGKLEAQRYHAVWEFDRISDDAHRNTLFNSEDNFLYNMNDEEYDLEKKFQHLRLEYFKGYLEGNLADILVKKGKQVHKVVLEEEARKESDKKSMAGDPTGFWSLHGIYDVFKDISLPTSIHEIALRSIWAHLPKYLERLAFPYHLKYPEVPKFESFGIPDRIHASQFPFQMPSCDSNNWSNKVLPSNGLMDSSVPPHFLLTLHKLCMENLINSERIGIENIIIHSADEELKLQCDRVMEAADEITRSHSEAESELHDNHVVSLADDTDEISKGNGNVMNFSFHEPLALLDEVSTMDMRLENFGTESKRYTTFLYKKHELCPDVNPEMVGLDLLNAGCPIELPFNDCSICFGPNELKTFKFLKKQALDFQKGFGLYQEYLTRANLEKQDVPFPCG